MLDRLDLEIINMLKKDGRMPFLRIADKLKCSEKESKRC